MNRRSWLKTAAGILAAPAVVRAESIMRVRPVSGNRILFIGDSLTHGMVDGPRVLVDLQNVVIRGFDGTRWRDFSPHELKMGEVIHTWFRPVSVRFADQDAQPPQYEVWKP